MVFGDEAAFEEGHSRVQLCASGWDLILEWTPGLDSEVVLSAPGRDSKESFGGGIWSVQVDVSSLSIEPQLRIAV